MLVMDPVVRHWQRSKPYRIRLAITDKWNIISVWIVPSVNRIRIGGIQTPED